MIVETAVLDGVIHNFYLEDGSATKKASLRIEVAHVGQVGFYVVHDIAQYKQIVIRCKAERQRLLDQHALLASRLAMRAELLEKAINEKRSPKTLRKIRVENVSTIERKAMALGFITHTYKLWQQGTIKWNGYDYFDPETLLVKPAEILRKETSSETV